MALALAIGLAGLAGSAAAQTPPAPPPAPPAAKKAPAAAPAKKPAAAAGQDQPAAAQSAWVKLCDKATAVSKGKDGKDEKKDVSICLTHHERLDGNTGMAVISAALRQVEGQDQQVFLVMVPLGVLLKPGMRAAIYPKDLWEKAQKNEQVDESKLKSMKLDFTLCHPGGCTAEIDATPELVNELKTSGGLVVVAFGVAGTPTGFLVPLNGFEQSYAGPPVDSKQYGEARRTLMQQIAARQQQLAEEQKKQQEAGQQPGAAQPPAKAAPAPAQKK